MGTSSLTMATLASTTGALWSGSMPVFIGAFAIAMAFVIAGTLYMAIKKTARKVLR